MTASDVHVAIDRYPTRTLERSGHIERTDPTVWGDTDGPMSRDEVESHDVSGYSIHHQLFDADETDVVAREVRALVSDPRLRGDPRAVIEKSSDRVRSIFDVHHLSALIAGLVSDARVVDRARQVLGSDVYIHQCRVNYLPGFGGTGFYWHSDFETWHAEDGMPSPRAVSMSIALCDNYAFNGGLMLMPGSQRTFVPCIGSTPRDNHRESLREQTIGVPAEADITELATAHGIEQFTGSAGSALLFDSNIMHGSGNNITPFPRSNVFVVFNSVENVLTEPFAADRRRPEFLASRDFTAVR